MSVIKRAWHDARVIFTALQACSVIAMLPALIGIASAVGGLAREELPDALWLGAGAGLWGLMWWSFLRMCGRLKREPSAFTAHNARTLLVIAVCCGGLGAMMAAEAVAAPRALARGLLFGGWIGGVATVALVLRRLLRSAMALQQDSDLTI